LASLAPSTNARRAEAIQFFSIGTDYFNPPVAYLTSIELDRSKALVNRSYVNVKRLSHLCKIRNIVQHRPYLNRLPKPGVAFLIGSTRARV
jgi:hypothetical protein